MAGGSLSDMVSDSVSFTAGSSVGFSMMRKPQSRNTGATYMKAMSNRQSPECYEYSNSQGDSTPRHEFKEDQSEFTNIGMNMRIME